MLKKLALMLIGLVLCGPLLAADLPRVRIQTSLGPLTLELQPARAPQTVANFLHYVDSGFYSGLVFHRVIPGFMVQGGGFSPVMERQDTRAPIPLEANNGLRNLRGSIAMARTNHPDSATSQFFINLVDNAFLDASAGQPGYTVFGRVIEGLEVIDRIAAQPTGNRGPFRDVPLQPILIESAERLVP